MMRGESPTNGRSFRSPAALLDRFGASVPGQVLVNTAVFRLPEELRIRSDWRVLEVSAGRASLTRVLAERSDLDVAPLALDTSAAMLRQARSDASAGGRPVELVCGSSFHLPLAADSFDLIIFSHAFKTLSDGELGLALREASRALKLGGICLAWEYAPTGSQQLDRWNRWLLARQSPALHLRSEREIRSVAYEAGFDWIAPAHLRPFLFPPIPRVSLIMGKAPPGWERRIIEGKAVLQYAPETPAAAGSAGPPS
jgi:ubiquinone/menaquinone biosynthesis C-methylase UbiE